MTSNTVLLQVLSTVEDPQALVRVLGVFAARSLLPQRFIATLAGFGSVEIEIQVALAEGECTTDAQHLARLIDRFPFVQRVHLFIDERPTPFDFSLEANETDTPDG